MVKDERDGPSQAENNKSSVGWEPTHQLRGKYFIWFLFFFFFFSQKCF